MAYVDTLYERNYLEYASYVIKDRAVPHINDGLKPVQRRILHSLFEVDDGRYHKVANVVGNTMKYHPHGDQSIFDALVVMANKELFIDKQGNFGNIFTGDEASAARYIECRLTPLAREVLHNPEITDFEDTYDGRNKEPVAFPAKIPVLLAMGSDGIAPGMTTRILPHNLIELMQAQIAYLKKKKFELVPDFLTGGKIDVSEYNDGNGKVLVRASLDTKDPKRIVIRELPFGSTSESLIASIEDAAKKGKLKISGISDYTAEEAEIEIRLARGVHTEDTVDALYAFTDCESSISVSLMVIKEGRPHIMGVTDVVAHNSEQLVNVLEAELKIEQGKLNDRLHAKTLEQIFIENRIYKDIEEQKTADAVTKAVHKGLDKHKSKIRRQVTDDDIETLLRIPIRRISRYDIDRAKEEMKDIRKRLKEIAAHLKDIRNFAVAYLEGLVDTYGKDYPRRTEIISFEKVDVREAAQRNLTLSYNKSTGYLGHAVSGNSLFEVSPYDRILVIRASGAWSVHDVPDKLFVDKGMLFCGFVDKDRVFTLVYRDKKGIPYLKRFTIDAFILNRGYNLVPDGARPVKLTTDEKQDIVVEYKPKPRVRILEETFDCEAYPVRGNKAKGYKLANREVKNARFVAQDEA